MFPVEKDIGGCEIPTAVGGKSNITKTTEKVHSRKALTDLTNAVKPSQQHLSRKVEEKKLKCHC